MNQISCKDILERCIHVSRILKSGIKHFAFQNTYVVITIFHNECHQQHMKISSPHLNGYNQTG